jgi:hypothetical protein
VVVGLVLIVARGDVERFAQCPNAVNIFFAQCPNYFSGSESGSFSPLNDERMHHYQRRRASITRLGL